VAATSSYSWIQARKACEKLPLRDFAEQNLKHVFESPDEPRPADKVLRELYEQYKPQKIALSFGACRGVQRSLTPDTYDFLAQKMGADAAPGTLSRR